MPASRPGPMSLLRRPVVVDAGSPPARQRAGEGVGGEAGRDRAMRVLVAGARADRLEVARQLERGPMIGWGEAWENTPDDEGTNGSASGWGNGWGPTLTQPGRASNDGHSDGRPQAIPHAQATPREAGGRPRLHWEGAASLDDAQRLHMARPADVLILALPRGDYGQSLDLHAHLTPHRLAALPAVVVVGGEERRSGLLPPPHPHAPRPDSDAPWSAFGLDGLSQSHHHRNGNRDSDGDGRSVSPTHPAQRVLPLLRAGVQDFLHWRDLTPASLERALHHAVARQAARQDPDPGGRQVRQLIHASVDGILVIDTDGRVLFCNAGAEALFGRGGRALIGQPFGLPLVGGESVEVDLHRPDGGTATAEMRSVPIDWDSRPAFLALLRDVTTRKEQQAQLVEYSAQLRELSHQAHRAADVERKRIATGLHDGVAQLLIGVKMQVARVLNNADRPDRQRDAVDRANSLLDETIKEVRTLMFDLQPPSLDDAGIIQAVRELGGQMRHQFGLKLLREFEPSAAHWGLDDADPPPLDPDIATALYRSIRELLINVVKHSGQMNATVRYAAEGDHFSVTVIDHGEGFEPGKSNGFGLRHVEDRIAAIHGTLDPHSAPGQGTRITLSVPMET